MSVEEPGKPDRPASGRPTKGAAALLPARILDIARELFLEQGFERTSLNQIAAAAGITKRTIYVKIGDKDALLAEVVTAVLRTARRKLEDPGRDVPVTQRLAGFGQSLVSLALDPDVLRLYRLVVAEGHRMPNVVALYNARVADSAHQRLIGLLQDEVEHARLVVPDPEVSARLLAMVILSDPQRAALVGEKPWTEEQSMAWVEAAVALFLRGTLPCNCNEVVR